MLSVLMLICCAIGFSAQAQTPDLGGQTPDIRVKEKLPNGEFIVVIDGVEQRTITAEHARQIAERNADLDRCTRARAVIDQELAKYDALVALLKKDSQLADAQATIERERAGRLEAMYNAEYGLRLKAEQLNNAHSKRPWLAKVFDNPYVEIGFKAIVPTVNMVRALRQ